MTEENRYPIYPCYKDPILLCTIKNQPDNCPPSCIKNKSETTISDIEIIIARIENLESIIIKLAKEFSIQWEVSMGEDI